MKLALTSCLIGSLSFYASAKQGPRHAIKRLFTKEKKHYNLAGDDITAEALALKDTVLHHIEKKHRKKNDRDLQVATEEECFDTEDGGYKCCTDLEQGNTACLTVWCDETQTDCTCELDFNEIACDGCLYCDAGLGFDCRNLGSPDLIDATCNETTTEPTNPSNPGAGNPGNGGNGRTECHPTSDGNYECCDYSTGSPVCITLVVSIKPAESSGSGTTWTSEGCSSIDSSSYNICIDATKTGTYTGMNWPTAAFNAKKKWESVIVGDLSPGDIRTNEYPPEFICGDGLPPVVDDLYICAKDPLIDGAGGVLGAASPVFVRNETGLPISGYMEFDSDDIQMMINDESLENVFLHEMGHVIGFGSLLQYKGLVTNQGTEDHPDFVYKSDTKACEKWQYITNCEGCPPIENEHGAGTAGGHWDEDVLQNELMTGFNELPGTPMPLSMITVGALEDLGYAVDYSKADPFPNAPQCTGSRRGLRSNVRFLGDKKGHRHHHHHGKGHHQKLSDVGRATAMEYGRQMLVKAHANRPKEETQGLLYVADKFASILVEEGKQYFSVELFTEA